VVWRWNWTIWIAPASLAAFCVDRVITNDYWGAAFGAFPLSYIVLLFLLPEEPSAFRRKAFRLLGGGFVLLCLVAIWATYHNGK
jgi:hypothetical protein